MADEKIKANGDFSKGSSSSAGNSKASSKVNASDTRGRGNTSYARQEAQRRQENKANGASSANNNGPSNNGPSNQAKPSTPSSVNNGPGESKSESSAPERSSRYSDEASGKQAGYTDAQRQSFLQEAIRQTGESDAIAKARERAEWVKEKEGSSELYEKGMVHGRKEKLRQYWNDYSREQAVQAAKDAKNATPEYITQDEQEIADGTEIANYYNKAYNKKNNSPDQDYWDYGGNSNHEQTVANYEKAKAYRDRALEEGNEKMYNYWSDLTNKYEDLSAQERIQEKEGYRKTIDDQNKVIDSLNDKVLKGQLSQEQAQAQIDQATKTRDEAQKNLDEWAPNTHSQLDYLKSLMADDAFRATLSVRDLEYLSNQINEWDYYLGNNDQRDEYSAFADYYNGAFNRDPQFGDTYAGNTSYAQTQRWLDRANKNLEDAIARGDNVMANRWRDAINALTELGYYDNNARRGEVQQIITDNQARMGEIDEALGKGNSGNAFLTGDVSGEAAVTSALDAMKAQRELSSEKSRLNDENKRLEEQLKAWGENTTERRDEIIAHKKDNGYYIGQGNEMFEADQARVKEINAQLKDKGLSKAEKDSLMAEKNELQQRIDSRMYSDGTNPDYYTQYSADLADKEQAELDEFDTRYNNGVRAYGARDIASKALRSAGSSIASSITETLGTAVEGINERARNAYEQGVASGELTGEYRDSEGLQNASKELYAAADALGQRAELNQFQATNQQSKATKWAVGAGINLAQMGFDAAVAAATGATSLAPMAVRVFGEASREMRNQGKDYDSRVKYGSLEAGKEILTEKISGVFDKFGYGKGIAGGFVETAVAELTNTKLGATALRFFANAVGEGAEEVLSSMLDPFVRLMAGVNEEGLDTFSDALNAAQFWKQDDETKAQILEEFIVGAALGFAGNAVSLVNGENAALNADVVNYQQGKAVSNLRRGSDLSKRDTKRLTEARQAGQMSPADAIRAYQRGMFSQPSSNSAQAGATTQNNAVPIQQGKERTNDKRSGYIDRAREVGFFNAPETSAEVNTAEATETPVSEASAESSEQVPTQAETAVKPQENGQSVAQNNESLATNAREYARQQRWAKEAAVKLEEERRDDAKSVQTKISDARGKMSFSGVKPVKDVARDRFAKNSKKDLRTMVTEYFTSLGNKVKSKALGKDVVFDGSGVRSDIAHGVGRAKAATFDAVPDVLEKGTIIDEQENWKGRGYDTKIIAAPITIDGKPAYVGCVVRSENVNGVETFYLHEVVDGNGNLIYNMDEMPALENAEKSPETDIKTGIAKGDTRAVSEPTQNVAQGDQAVKGNESEAAESPEESEATAEAPIEEAAAEGDSAEQAQETQSGREGAARLAPKEDQRGIDKETGINRTYNKLVNNYYEDVGEYDELKASFDGFTSKAVAEMNKTGENEIEVEDDSGNIGNVSRQAIEAMQRATRENPVYCVNEYDGEGANDYYQAYRFDGASFVCVQVDKETGDILRTYHIGDPKVVAKMLTGMGRGKRTKTNFGQNAYGVKYEDATRGAEKYFNIGELQGDPNYFYARAEQGDKVQPDKTKAQPSSRKRDITSNTRANIYKSGDVRTMETESAKNSGRSDFGKYDSASTEEVSRIADHNVNKDGIKAEYDRLMNAANWDRVDIAEAQKIIVKMQLDLAEKMTDEHYVEYVKGETGAEYQARRRDIFLAERQLIDDLMERHMQVKSEHGASLQQKYKISIFDEIRIRASKRFLDYAEDGMNKGNNDGFSKGSSMYSVINSMLKEAETLTQKSDTKGLIELAKKVSYVRGNQNLFGRVGQNAEAAALEYLSNHGWTAEDISNLTAGNINRMIDDFNGVKPVDAFNQLRVMNMLSAPVTAFNNVINNAMNMRMGTLAQKLSKPAAEAFERITGKKVYIKEPMLRGKETWEAEKAAFVNAALMSYYGIEIDNGRLETKNFAQFNPNGNAFERFLARYSFLINTAVMNPDVMGKARIDRGMQQGIDEMFQGELTAEQMANKGELERYKEHEKRRRLVQADDAVTALAQHLKNLANKVSIGNEKIGRIRAGDFIMPFAKVPVNIVEQRVASTPFGAMYHLLRFGQGLAKAKADPTISAGEMAKYSRDLGRAATSMGMLAIGALAASTGALRDFGNDDDDDETKKRFAELGYTGLCLNLEAMLRGGEWKEGDTIIDGTFLEILSVPLSVGAMCYDAYASGMSLMDSLVYSTKRSFTDVLDAMGDLPGMQAAQQLYDAYVNSKEETGLDAVLSAGRQYVASAIPTYIMPNAISQTAAGLDNTVRDTYRADSDWQQTKQIMASKFPFLRNMVPAKLDSWGEERTYGANRFMGFLNKAILPGDITKLGSTKYDSELARLSKSGFKNVQLETSVPKQFTVDGETYKMSADEQRAFQAARAEYASEAYKKFMDSEEYKNLSDPQRQEILRQLRSDASWRAERAFFDSRQDLDVEIKADRWQTELKTLDERLEFLTAKSEMKDWYAADADNRDFKAMDDFLRNDYANMSETQQKLLTNSYGRLDDMYDALTNHGISSERYTAAMEIFQYYNSTDDDGKKNFEANNINSTRMWADISNALDIEADSDEMQYYTNEFQLSFVGHPNKEGIQEMIDRGLNYEDANSYYVSADRHKTQTGYSDGLQNGQKYRALAETNMPEWKKFETWFTLVASTSTRQIANMSKDYELLKSGDKSVTFAGSLHRYGYDKVYWKELVNGKWVKHEITNYKA